MSVVGFCFACRSNVSNPRLHYSSLTHQENAARWERRQAKLRGEAGGNRANADTDPLPANDQL